jgi:hypothetical protein
MTPDTIVVQTAIAESSSQTVTSGIGISSGSVP